MKLDLLLPVLGTERVRAPVWELRMRFLGTLLFGMLLTALSACVTSESLPFETKFNQNSQHSLVIFFSTIPAPNETNLRGIDISDQSFVEASYSVSSGMNAPSGNMVQPERAIARLVALEIEPGHYAITRASMKQPPIENGKCFNLGAPVYEFKSGAVQVIRTDTIWVDDIYTTDKAILSHIEVARKSYPNIDGEASVAHPEFAIAWGSYSCAKESNFEILDPVHLLK